MPYIWIILFVVPFPLYRFLASKASEGERMRKDELMKADLFSEILLLGSGVAIAVALAMVVVAALTSAASLQ
jgi:hypothetical protein